VINETIFGVVELASLSEFTQHQIEFLEKLSENIAATIKTVKDNERTVLLLAASQEQAEELRAQEEEMRQNVEEMAATQEEMKRQADELSKATSEIRGTMAGIDATMAAIEFTPEGIILTANDNFLKTVKYTLPEIKGKHHSIFVPNDMLDSAEYRDFWKQLSSGNSFTGTFSRVSSKGERIWLNAIYNPIKDVNGKVYKVVKFASDITEQQMMISENKGIWSGIDATMATIEFTPDGIILDANDKFLKATGYRLQDIKGKHHKIFMPPDLVSEAEYRMFWERLGSGQPISGTFKRLTSTKDVVWLQATYSPIMDPTGKIIKVVKFANEVTEQQQLISESRGILEGINATMATIEFSKEGIISNANPNFLQTMRYHLPELKGRHHKVLVPKEMVYSSEYKMFWERLANGEAFKGTFERVRSDGTHVILNAIYNPIKDASGAVVKVLKFATEVTGLVHEHEQLASKHLQNGTSM
jgi:PAS domain S-box-containing protein